MSIRHLAFLLLVTFAMGQAAPPAPVGTNPKTNPSTPAATIPEANVSPSDTVITMNGFCPETAPSRDVFQTVITRQQFEKLTDALQPGMSLPLRLNVAKSYARNLRMSAVAERRGLDKTPAFEQEMRFARAQLLAQDLDRALKAEANNITDAELAAYYTNNLSSFEQATVARIFVPHAQQIASPSGDAKEPNANSEALKKAAEEAMTRAASELRTLAMNGEDPDELQKRAYAEAGMTGTTANTRMENVRRTTLPPRHESILELQPGQVSQVFSDPAGAHFIYKMISKVTLTLEEAKAEMRTAISSQRYRDSIESFQGNDFFDEDYFIPSRSRVIPTRKGKPRQNSSLTEPSHDSQQLHSSQ